MALKPKDAPDLSRFDWEDAFRMDDQLSEEERMLRDGARAYAQEKLQSRVIAAYRDVAAHKAFITNVSVLKSHRSRGVASNLLKAFLTHCSAIGICQVVLEVDADNLGAVSLYRSHGFNVDRKEGNTMTLILNLGVDK